MGTFGYNMTIMAKAVKLSEELVAEAKKHAAVNCRSVPGQIEFWAKVAMAAEANPDLPFHFIKGILISMEEINNGKELEEYKFGPLDS